MDGWGEMLNAMFWGAVIGALIIGCILGGVVATVVALLV